MKNDTATKAPRPLARPLPNKDDFAPFDFTKVDKSKNHRRGTPSKRKVRVHL